MYPRNTNYLTYNVTYFEIVNYVKIIFYFAGLFKQTQVLTRALVPDYEKNENKQSIIYGKMAAISGAGITVGPVIGGHLAEDHPEGAFAFIGVVVGICFVLNAGNSQDLKRGITV